MLHKNGLCSVGKKKGVFSFKLKTPTRKGNQNLRKVNLRKKSYHYFMLNKQTYQHSSRRLPFRATQKGIAMENSQNTSDVSIRRYPQDQRNPFYTMVPNEHLAEMQKSKMVPAFYAIIPAHVRYCKKLEPAAKLLYGEITALCNQEGYCWAGNEYFANLYDCDISTIKRWVESLKKHNFVRVEIIRHGMFTSRKIYIIPEGDSTGNSKNVCEVAKMPPPAAFQKENTTAQKCAPGGLKNEPYNNTYPNNTKNNNKPAAPVVVSFDALKELNLPASSIKTIQAEFQRNPEWGQERLDHCVRWLKAQTNIDKPGALFLWALRELPSLPEIIDPSANKALAKRFEESHESSTYRIEVLDKLVEFIPLGAQCSPTAIAFASKSFKKDFEENIMTKGFVEKENLKKK